MKYQNIKETVSGDVAPVEKNMDLVKRKISFKEFYKKRKAKNDI